MDFEKLIRYRNERNHFARKLGIEIEELRLGYAKVRKTVEEDDANPLGLAHGGVYFAVADCASGTAASTHGHKAVTLSANWNYFRSAAPGDVLTGEAVETKSGKTIRVYDVRISGQNGTLLGTGSFTYYVLPEELEL